MSLNNKYYTFKNGLIYEHHYESTEGTSNSYNNFYGTQYISDITALLNDLPNSVKGFSTLNYEGSSAFVSGWGEEVDNQGFFTGDHSVGAGLVSRDNVSDGEYSNMFLSPGWYVDNLITNLQSCGNVYFKNKEDKYFGFPTGDLSLIHI